MLRRLFRFILWRVLLRPFLVLLFRALRSWYRHFGLWALLALLPLVAALTVVPVTLLADNNPYVAWPLWVLSTAFGTILADVWRAIWIGAPCGRGGSSRWLRAHEIRRKKFRRGAIYLGRSFAADTLKPMHLGHADDRHVLTIAPNRGGKGRSLIIPNLRLWPGSVLTIDPKAENVFATWKDRQALGQRVAALDPFGELARQNGGKPLGIEVGYNPLLDIDPSADDVAEQIGTIVDAIVLSEGEQNTHWTEGTRQLIKGLAALVLLMLPEEDKNLGTVHWLLTHRAQMDLLYQEALEEPRKPHELWRIVSGAYAQLSDATDATRDNWMSTAARNLDWLATAPIRDCVSTPIPRAMKDLKGGDLSLYIVLPPDKLSLHSRWLRIVVSLAMAACAREQRKPKHAVLFLLDEFAQLRHLAEIESALGILAGYGIKLWPILQDLAQLKRCYPRSWESFIAASGCTTVFAVQDSETAAYFAHMAGERLRRGWEHVDDPGLSAVPLVTADELRRITRRERGTMVVLGHGSHPMLAARVNHDSRTFARLLRRVRRSTPKGA